MSIQWVILLQWSQPFQNKTVDKANLHDKMECMVGVPVLVAHSSLAIPSMNISSFRHPSTMSPTVSTPTEGAILDMRFQTFQFAIKYNSKP